MLTDQSVPLIFPRITHHNHHLGHREDTFCEGTVAQVLRNQLEDKKTAMPISPLCGPPSSSPTPQTAGGNLTGKISRVMHSEMIHVV